MIKKLTYTLSIISTLLFIGLFFNPYLCAAENPGAPESISTEEISRLFHEANSMFAEADKLAVSDPEKATALYKKSILRFERIIKEGGIENGKLYYDLGNIYFRTKDIGRAILNYRRAEQYIGNDVNLQQNLEFARNTRKDHIEEKQQTKILKTLFFWHYDFSAKTRLILFTVSFILLWFFSIICIFIKKPFFKWSISITAAASVLFAGSLLIDYVTFKKSIPGVIISQEVVARKGNSESYKKSFKDPLHAGTEFTLLEHRGNWLQVELPDARTCWLPASDVELVR
jgi:tetratricopeptide (TPR) repeat protein